MLDDSIHNTPVGFALCDRQGRFVYVNDALAELSGIPRETCVGRPVSELFPDRAVEVDQVIRRIDEGEASVELEVTGETARDPGVSHTWRLTWYPVQLNGESTTIAAIVEDVTLRRRAEEAMQKAVTARDEFVSFVSHELRGPLTIIQGYASLLTRQKELLDSGQWQTAVDEIYRETVRLNDIVANLLAMARLDHGVHVTIEPLVFRHAIRPALDDFRQTSHREIIESFPERVITVQGNDTFLGQVVRNLLSNAEKYSPDDTPITLEAHEEPDRMVISVSDQGIGMEEDEVERVFEPFFRSIANEARPGVGIGLTVSKRLVEAMGGSMWVESKKGEGSTFFFSLAKFTT